MTPGISNMFFVISSVLFLNHLVGCFWFLMAKLMDFPETCWVSRQLKGWHTNFDNNPDFDITPYLPENNYVLWYTMSFYWALQTLLTVGFGDINGKNMPERIFCIIWIICAVSFYSYSIGNVANVISSMDMKDENLEAQLQTL